MAKKYLLNVFENNHGKYDRLLHLFYIFLKYLLHDQSERWVQIRRCGHVICHQCYDKDKKWQGELYHSKCQSDGCPEYFFLPKNDRATEDVHITIYLSFYLPFFFLSFYLSQLEDVKIKCKHDFKKWHFWLTSRKKTTVLKVYLEFMIKKYLCQDDNYVSIFCSLAVYPIHTLSWGQWKFLTVHFHFSTQYYSTF